MYKRWTLISFRAGQIWTFIVQMKNGCARDPMCMHTLTCTHIDLNTHTHTGMLLLALPSWLWKLSTKTFVMKTANLRQMCSCLFCSLRMGVLGLRANKACDLDSGYLWNGVISCYHNPKSPSIKQKMCLKPLTRNWTFNTGIKTMELKLWKFKKQS